MAERKNPLVKKEVKARKVMKSGSKLEEFESGYSNETRATFIVDKAKLKAIKIYAATNEMQIKEVINEAITEFLDKHS